ncbi:MAG TPA: hypothetical protein DF383_10180 [Deltaproteobacteria bacterium]|nr:hypothetical protein [Deltaproteobacteria bacterium]
MKQAQTHLIEIFSSLQGEGPYAGEAMVFVRFQDCALSCRFCDTPASFERHASFRREITPFRADFEFHPNPVDAESLTRWVSLPGISILSLTGGEPLQQAEFLQSWLPQVHGKFRILLESNGVLPQALVRVLDWVDIVSMDIKLPSVTGMRAYWKEHAEFLRLARRKEVYVKVVVGNPTDLNELKTAIAIVEAEAPQVPFILQPVTPFGQVRESILERNLEEMYDISKTRLADVRVIPQLHPRLGIL